MVEPAGFSATVERAQRGDRDALAHLTQQFGVLVGHACQAFWSERHPELSVTDLQQEVWLRVLCVLPQFRGDAEDAVCLRLFRSWLRTTARSVALNLVTARRRRKRSADGRRLDLSGLGSAGMDSIGGIDDSTPSGRAAKAEEERRIRLAMARIAEPINARIIELSFVEGLTLREIALRLDCPYDQVRRRFHRTIDELRTFLT
ncbi:MAG: sigma-70 family RNA polymerase sigma factor [Pirellulaceae bacterium]|nr:sigma-70 family RNA polymerase sigma factor [Pirellulaceae bacterium]